MTRAWSRLPVLLSRVFNRYWGLLLLIAGWQVWVSLQGYNTIVLPSPAAVLSDLVSHADLYWPHLQSTTVAALVGLGIGFGLGVCCAGCCWFTPLLDGLLTPAMVVLRAVPVVATIPIIARLCGYDSSTVVVVTSLLVFFPVFVFCSSGLRDIPPACADLFAALGCRSRWRTFRLLALPTAIPYLASALRLAAPGCVLAALIAEFLMGTEGLGYVMMRARSDLLMERSWGAALIATLLSVLLYSAAVQLESFIRSRWAS